VTFVDARHRRHDLTRRAITALEGILVDEGLLHGMKRAIRSRQSFDGCNRCAHRDGERQARQDALAANVDGTCAALAMIATFFGPGQVQMFAQRIQQAGAGIKRQPLPLTVDEQLDWNHLPITLLTLRIRFGLRLQHGQSGGRRRPRQDASPRDPRNRSAAAFHEYAFLRAAD
jgi:hypothetical protein